MNLKYLVLLSCFTWAIIVGCDAQNYRAENVKKPDEQVENKIKSIYENAKLAKVLSFDFFRMAMIGFYNMDGLKKSDKIVLIDFSKPSTKERFYVVNLEKKELLYKCLVAHGKNSGATTPSDFSNTPESKKSSLGFFLTAETYNGKHGFSLKLDGIEKGINHNARKRAIVIHSANYVSAEYVKKNGALGRSWGCPALPVELSTEIIKLIANGTCMFIYANDSDYLKESKYTLKAQ